VERETGFEPATPSLEGWRSTAELFPPFLSEFDTLKFTRECPSARIARVQMVGRGGFEPPKAYASRFTVCPLWPLGYLPDTAGMRLKALDRTLG
jgi:hypothetical protein